MTIMKFLTYSINNETKLGILINKKIYAVQDLDASLPNEMEVFVQEADKHLSLLQKACEDLPVEKGIYENEVTIHAPLRQPGSVRDFMAFENHLLNAAETSGINIAPEWYEIPAFYFTNHRTIHGPYEDIERPPNCEMLDFELEVAIVIGKEGKNICADEADDYIFGYTIFNDWSARDLQLKEMPIGLGPAKGKDFATSIGPYIVTKDELEPFRENKGFNLKMTATVNGKELSNGNFNSIYYSFNEMIERASNGVTLYPGDVIGSGTVGTGCILEFEHGLHPWLADGDEVTLAVEELGTLTNTIKK